MAEIAVNLAVNLVTDYVIPWLLEEVKLSKGLDEEFAAIKGELESIQSFLKDADARDAEGDRGDTSTNNGLKTWVKQVRETAYRIEDVVDEYMLCVAQYRHQQGVIDFLKKPARKMKIRSGIASKIEEIKDDVHRVAGRRLTYGLQPLEQGSGNNNITWHDPRVASHFIDEAEIVGIEFSRGELVQLLVRGTTKKMVVSVVGMGGLGKTTLVKKVYDHQMVVGSFDCRAWIDVPQAYKIEELLRTLIRHFCPDREESIPKGIDTRREKVVLLEKLRECLQQKRYVVVFDDVWRDDFWKTIEFAFPDNNKGSRIIITTRSEDVASYSKESSFHHVYKLQPLPEKSAWELFCKKAFQSDFGYGCPMELKDLSLKIVRRCEGLPIAIAQIGGLLSTCRGNDVSQWKKLHDSLGSELVSNPRLISVARILSLSYLELPYYLKCCFLYFGIFPKDYSISCTRLIRLWIAEGFIEKKRDKTLEQVAEEYLIELIHRSLVQVSRVGFDGKARSCRVHDLLREIILLKLEYLNLCKVVAEEDPSFDGKTRRLSIQNSKSNVVESINDNSLLRSVFLFEAENFPKSLTPTFFTKFKFLKVLDFQDAPLNYVHEEVGNLFNLRYFSLRRTKVTALPKSIGQLHILQTLDLKHSLVQKLPMEINQLKSLRHLLAKSFNYGGIDFEFLQGVKIKEGVGCLEELQKLCLVEAAENGGLITELKKLTQMRKLGIRKLKLEHGKPLCASIEKMKSLQSLTLHSTSEAEFLDIHHISSPPLFLRHLCLQGRLAMLPNWISKLQNLVRIRFNWAGLQYDPLKVLQAMPNLMELGLYHAFDGEQLYFEEGGFQKLKVLRLSYLSRLNHVMIDRGALPLLGQLTIRSCQQLVTVPVGIDHLSKATVNFFDMPEEFETQMYPFVRHIPAVIFNYRREGGGYNSITLG